MTNHSSTNAEQLSSGQADLPKSRSRWGWLILLGIAFVWTLELYGLQWATLDSEVGWGRRHLYPALLLRFTLTGLFCLAMTLLLPRLLLVVSFFVLLVFIQVASFYQDYFGRALSWTTIRSLYREGGDSVVIDKDFILPWVLITALVLLVIKLGMLYASYRVPIRWRRRALPGAVLVVAYLVVIVAYNQFGRTRLERMAKWESFDHIAVAHGYLATWVGQWLYVGDQTLYDQAIAERDNATDRITPLEGVLDLPGHLVILQVESLDWHVLGKTHQGKPITPFLNDLRERSMLFMIESPHGNGSADADFSMLYGYPASRDVINYKLDNYPADDTLPELSRAANRPMHFYHGFHGRFFNRETAYSNMDWEEVSFKDQLVESFGLPVGKWSAVHDREVLGLAAEHLQQAAAPITQMVITFTSHIPFKMLADDEPRAFDNPNGESYLRYINSIYYVDDVLRDYVESLPEGTTVVIYADHESLIDYPDRPADKSRPEFGPAIVYRAGEDLSKQQKTRNMPEATSGEWTRIDLAQWVRAWLIAEAEASDVNMDGR